MAKKQPSEQDFMSLMKGSLKGSSTTDQTSKPGMKLNRPPSASGLSTDELYEKTEHEQRASAARAEEMLGALPTVGVVRKIPLSRIIDSPFQPRLRYDPIKLDALGESLRTAGQAEPISVRIVGEYFELLGGHRRSRAARNVGWVEIEAHVKEADDRTAEQIVMLQNEGREDLSEYERGKMFKKAVERGYAKTQSDVAAMFGCSQPTVSNCLKLLALPAEIITFLEATPDLFGSTVAKDIQDLLKNYPNELPLVVEAVQRVVEGAEASNLRSWVMMKITSRSRVRKKNQSGTVTGRTGRTLFSTKAETGKVQVILGDGLSVDEDTVMRWIIAALRERAEQAEKPEEDLSAGT